MQLAESGELTEILQTHAENMESAGRCRTRHGALVELLEQIDDQTNDEPENE